MSMDGELYRVPADRLQEMLVNPQLILDELYPGDADLYSARRDQRGLNIDKAWDGIHFLVRSLIRQRRLPWIDPVPWHAVAEESETGASSHYGPICYRTTEQAAEIARAVAQLKRADLEAVYDPPQMMKDSVYPQTWDRPGEFEYLWTHFRDLTEFYGEAAACGDGVLLWLA
jgi:hypothetical protein